MLLLPVRAQWLDHFDDICSLSAWSDIQVTEGWNIQSLESHDISLTNPGRLTLMPYTVSWFADYRGPLLYRMAADDFVMTGNISVTNRAGNSIPGSAYSLGGFMVRNPKSLTNGASGWIAGQEDYVFLSIGHASNGHPSCFGCPGPHFEVKSTNNSNSNLNISSVDTAVADIRMVRLHPYVLVLYRHPGEEWVVHRRYFRNDLNDTVQVGMVTYTDWDKVATYTMPFHNSHVLNDDLNPDPSNNSFIPFAPDIISQYDYIALENTSMPVAWAGLDLTNPNVVSDAQILEFYGNAIPIPVASTEAIWLGGANSSWNDVENWLPAAVPTPSDDVRINSCACPEAHAVELPMGTTVISELHVMTGGQLTVPAGAILEINEAFTNEGMITVFGHLIVNSSATNPANNFGTIDCRTGGLIHIMD
jgi:hypothetical protein